MNRSVRSVIYIAAALMIPFAAQVAEAQPVERDHAGELACGARALGVPPDMSIRIGPGREQGKALFGPTDMLVIRAGTSQGVKIGQEYFVRRVVSDRFVPNAPDR